MFGVFYDVGETHIKRPVDTIDCIASVTESNLIQFLVP